ncbi:hypothetical protein ACJEDW_13005, partial [Escherichia coli]
DRNRSHWSTSKTPSYTKSVSWQHHRASNVGVVIFSTQDSANTFNVLNASGGSRSVYPVMSDDMNGSSWKFSTRMQKIDPALSVTSGQLMSHVLVDIYYE